MPADQYALAFQAARDTLRDARYSLDRVDAPQGVLTSVPKSEPGLAKPWEAHSGTQAAVDDFLQYQQRTVQVAFITGQPPQHKPGDAILPLTNPDRDLTVEPAETTMLVRVVVQRIERDGQRVSADSVRVTRQAVDPELKAKGFWPSYLVQVDDDSVLAASLLQEIVARMQRTAPPAPAATSAAETNTTAATPSGGDGR